MGVGCLRSARGKIYLVISVTVLGSWVVGIGTTNYLTYLQHRTVYREVVSRLGAPAAMGRKFPAPTFGWPIFLFGPGPPPVLPARGKPLSPPRAAATPDGQGVTTRIGSLAGPLALRLALALLFAAVAGWLLSRQIVRPLHLLAAGARRYQAGDFAHRISLAGEDESAQVAGALHAMAETVLRQLAQLREQELRRQRFLADISHELRRPATTIQTMTGAWRDGLLDSPRRREQALANIAAAGEQLAHLVRDLTDLAHLDLDAFALSCRTCDAGDLARAAVETHREAIAGAGQSIDVFAPPSGPEAWLDPGRIAQALDNLLENAIAYAGPGAHVTIEVLPGDPLNIVIADTGRGIPVEHLPHLFNSFYRVGVRDDDEQGTGLGLRIVKSIVEAHDGTVNLESHEGLGTVVTLSLPVRTGDESGLDSVPAGDSASRTG